VGGRRIVPVATRAQAYDLVPDVPFNDPSPPGICCRSSKRRSTRRSRAVTSFSPRLEISLQPVQAVVLPRPIRETCRPSRSRSTSPMLDCRR